MTTFAPETGTPPYLDPDVVAPVSAKGESHSEIRKTTRIKVRIFTLNYMITGNIHVGELSRASDEVDDEKRQFLAVTEATVYTPFVDKEQRRSTYKKPFMSVRKDTIVVWFPEDGEKPKENGGGEPATG